MKRDKIFGVVISVMCVVLLVIFLHLFAILGEPSVVWLYELLGIPVP